ncbi:MAG: bifunctional riboflavin kinase/FAD synthetase [Chitinophagaceae bacterium]
MNVHTDITRLASFRNAVLTIGTFDGVHLGHHQIIDQLREEARKVNGETVIITFYPHPRQVVRAASSPLYLINTPQEKRDLLEACGIDHLVIVPFTQSFANQSAEEYVENFLIALCHPHTLIIGYDHRFGHGRTGDFHLLETYASKQAFHLIEIPQHLLHESAISSTRIRENLLSGNLQEANELLGYAYFFEGTVVEGNKLGRTLGYPTANLQINSEEKLVPCNGVYAVWAIIKDSDNDATRYKGMMNIGVRPTVDGTRRAIEVNLFDFDEDIYGKTMRVHLKKHLRDEQKFNDLEALKEQLAKDKVDALSVL